MTHQSCVWIQSGSRFKRSGVACLSPSYTGNWVFSKLGHLAILSNSIEPWPMTKGKKVTFDKNTKVAEPYFDKSSAQISNLVYKTWFSRYPRCWYIIYNDGSKFNLHFQSLCNTYGIKHKPASVKNPQANAILEHIHAVIGNMLCTSESLIWLRWWNPLT